jgi:hypothetical protein
VKDIQKVVDESGRPIDVVGSAAKGAGRSPAENLPYGKGPRTKSDIDYVTTPSSLEYYKGMDGRLPGLDPKTGIVPGTRNPYIGPSLRFEPGSPPRFVPGQ